MRRRRGISSIYGFIVIFLLCMASLQTWSTAISSMASIEGASDQSNQLQQMQQIEHLSLQVIGHNLTIINNGDIASTVEYLRLVAPNDSQSVSIQAVVAVGDRLTEHIPLGYAVEVVTALGNVFTISSADPADPVWSGVAGYAGVRNAQVFQSPYDPSSLFLASGATVYAFPASGGGPSWSFSAGRGFVTDVMPLSGGDMYVSVGYGSAGNTADLFELSPNGTLLQTFPVRTLQTTDNGAVASNVPVIKGQDSGYAYYDGWFYSSGGAQMPLRSDGFELAGSDASDFYFYNTTQPSDCLGSGNEVTIRSYSQGASSGMVQQNWSDTSHVESCNLFLQQPEASVVGNGVVAILLASAAYAVSPNEEFPGQNPYLLLLSSSGQQMYEGQAPEVGYTSVATNGADVYMALPQLNEIQVFSISQQLYSIFHIGTQASQLFFEQGKLFAISNDAVQVFDSSMNLEKTIDFSPLTLASFSDSLLGEPALQTPSFLVLNSTSYAALLVNDTGYTNLVTGDYS